MSPDEAVAALWGATKPLTKAEVVDIVNAVYVQAHDDGYEEGHDDS
jgi:hypothetical protein